VIASRGGTQQVSQLAEQIVQKAMASGKFIFADTDVKFDQPQTEVVFDRDKLRSQGVDLTQAGQDLSTCWAETTSTVSAFRDAATR